MTTTQTSTEHLVGLLGTDLPAVRSAALEVLWMADDPELGVADLGRVVMRDPGLTQRVMRLANSAYYGLSGRVGDATFAISVIGFETLRAIAAITAAGIDGSRRLPHGHLSDAAAAAVGAALVAPRLGVRSAEAHSLGLLHNIGSWLLYRQDPVAHVELRRRAIIEGVPVHHLELGHHGTHSGEVGALLLESWRFPRELSQALAVEHEPADHPRTPLGMSLRVGLALAALVRRPPGSCVDAADHHASLLVAFEPGEVAAVTARVRADADRLEASIGC